MTKRGRVKLFPDKVNVEDNPNYKRYKDTSHYFSKMGDVVRVCNGKEYKVTPSKQHGLLCVHTSAGVVSVARTIYDLHIGIKNKNNVIVHLNGVITDNNLANLMEMPRRTSSRNYAGRKPRLVYDKITKKIYRSAQQYAKENYYSLKTVYRHLRNEYKVNNIMYLTEEEAMNL